MDAIEHLEEVAWERPDSYGAWDSLANPVGDYCIYSRHRDNEILVNVNYEEILNSLYKLQEKISTQLMESGEKPSPDEEWEEWEQRPWVYDFRAGHWAVGWVEYIIVRKDAPYEILKEAGEIVCALAQYPVLNDQAYSDACWEAINAEWEGARMQDRIEYCKDVEISIFAARRDEVPTEVYDRLSDTQGFY